MDDFTIASLQESKNEWSARLMNILTPLIIEGFKSIYDEANRLCIENDETDKLLMTFQNLITRIPKWNSNIINTECERIIAKSNCNYLEDLSSCVHVIQLKVLTCVRVGSKQKKIDINIPKLTDFIHSCYIHTARKVYTNVYLYDNNVLPLQFQKHKRELEVIIQECILNAIRESLPIEHILRNYMDETIEEDVVETIEEEKIESNESIGLKPETKINNEVNNNDNNANNANNANNVNPSNIQQEKPNEEDNNTDKDINLSLTTETPLNIDTSNDTSSSLKFNDNDMVLESDGTKNTIDAPKTIEHLQKIQQEKAIMESEYDDESDDEDYIPKLNIGGEDIDLGDLDVHDVNAKVTIEPDILLDDVEILS